MQERVQSESEIDAVNEMKLAKTKVHANTHKVKLSFMAGTERFAALSLDAVFRI